MLRHVGLEVIDKEKAMTFFLEVLGLKKTKSFLLNLSLTKDIFNLEEEVEVEVFTGEGIELEVFITDRRLDKGYLHLCLEVENKESFIDRSKKHGLKPKIIKKGEKELLFIRDFSGNLYEIKEKSKL
ncbi:VOC family protein [bacterium]|nr:VOC family protein [bacterium]MBU0899446.1 VOC family protein [bacterium]MBU1153426.1 VOC family protein [bacterium]MBU1782931.1 VOC family protein [bacterium]MBU2599256.1 VOC family protein [bacterium]